MFNGNTEASIAAPPDELVLDGLGAVKAQWDIIRPPLEVALVASKPNQTVINKVINNNIPLLQKSNDIVNAYVSAANQAGANTPGVLVNTAGRQRMLSQKMSKESLMVNLGISTSADVLQTTMDEFQDAHSGMLRGVEFLGLPPTVNMCTLWQMRRVSYLWTTCKPHVQAVIETAGEEEKASKDLQEAAIVEIAALNVPLLEEMNKAVGLYAAPKQEENCKPNMTSACGSIC